MLVVPDSLQRGKQKDLPSGKLSVGFLTTQKEPWRHPYEKGQYTQVGNVSIISCSRPNIDAKSYMESRRQRLAELFVNYASARASLSMK